MTETTARNTEFINLNCWVEKGYLSLRLMTSSYKYCGSLCCSLATKMPPRKKLFWPPPPLDPKWNRIKFFHDSGISSNLLEHVHHITKTKLMIFSRFGIFGRFEIFRRFGIFDCFKDRGFRPLQIFNRFSKTFL